MNALTGVWEIDLRSPEFAGTRHQIELTQEGDGLAGKYTIPAGNPSRFAGKVHTSAAHRGLPLVVLSQLSADYFSNYHGRARDSDTVEGHWIDMEGRACAFVMTRVQ